MLVKFLYCCLDKPDDYQIPASVPGQVDIKTNLFLESAAPCEATASGLRLCKTCRRHALKGDVLCSSGEAFLNQQLVKFGQCYSCGMPTDSDAWSADSAADTTEDSAAESVCDEVDGAYCDDCSSDAASHEECGAEATIAAGQISSSDGYAFRRKDGMSCVGSRGATQEVVGMSTNAAVATVALDAEFSSLETCGDSCVCAAEEQCDESGAGMEERLAIATPVAHRHESVDAKTICVGTPGPGKSTERELRGKEPTVVCREGGGRGFSFSSRDMEFLDKSLFRMYAASSFHGGTRHVPLSHGFQ